MHVVQHALTSFQDMYVSGVVHLGFQFALLLKG